MRLFVGLGNPGAQYAHNRHNIGFMVLDRIAADHGFTPWREKFQGKIASGTLGGEKTLLLKPETYMNRSGQSVGEAMRFYKLGPGDVTVFHDELDLAPGKLRVKQGGGHAGHNGLRSLHSHIGETYARVRLGIGHPGHKDRVTAHVLGDFSGSDQGWLDDLMRAVSGAAPHLAGNDPQRFMSAVAQAMPPGDERAAAPRGEKAGGSAKAAGTREQPGATDPAAPDERSPLQRLVDRFR
ncbi:aminoacyl-tRNA hydrolase [Pontibaca methylaminivorans]|uniref:Peptidyl-tRNA hydrolase n=1 Tax=Pontibaca methylaminivorans TaxID=515897 RepID=A0A1R3WIC2_9RHOB|nr:aminoacyl-tRNA hydrolase [Pontibaca methylaminivorans]SIT77687.1 peptidyl-tRNA hydrolase [Pontibaca methylaminivorans]